MQEIVVRFGERLVGVQLADPHENVPLPLADVVASSPTQSAGPQDAAAQLATLRASLDDLRLQLTAQIGASPAAADELIAADVAAPSAESGASI